MPNSTYSQDLRFFLPETVWLETEHFAFAKEISSTQGINHNDSWQTYLNALAIITFEEWLKERLPNKVISRDTDVIATAGNLKVDEFKFCAIATEHVLDEIVRIPQEVIANPELAAHFYVLIEVSEEEEEVVIRGFVTHKQLTEIKSNLRLSADEGCYHIPLSLFDMEPSHLLFYQRYVQASEFAVPVVGNKVTQISENISELVSITTTRLSQWLQGVIDEGWQAIDSLSQPQLSLAFSTRNIDKSVKKAKIIDLGIDLGNKKVALLVHISPENSINNQASESSQDKIHVLAQLYPMNGEKFLPQNTKLQLISKAGKVLQEVTSRIQDNYIQLKPFRGEAGKKFSIQISLEDVIVKENFEL
ncbi:Protein of unknown function (DUF1822) [Rivularia sp. PCC 7116]|uniref:DUF1822 family protein n=1 Tax=Rivularia sp. PCC 7116 TaxID=373994 RepID=UPI00029ED2F4|nr:DUF1822 family protein [Rivularia sp. PCC 7116]AFY58574.1 Protein of unknown function (DUF1822) [Rivularia sp. PCC 7116]